MNINTKFLPVPHRLGLYPVIDSLTWLKRLLDTGVTTIQFRIKNQTETELNKKIEAAVLLGNKYDVKLFINDYWKLAIQYGAYGVHLGQEDMNSADLNTILKYGLRLGLSTHSEKELLKALSCNPSYISLGHIFPTNTKKMFSKPQGLEKLFNLGLRLKNIPTVAISGININNIENVLSCGIGGISVVSAITKASNWYQTTIQLLEIIKNWENKYVNK
ncbi:thiamine phosphate synthase (plasmid) [Candidatus Pantoea edessiphila]|uniref:Thiamine-phosphate synthase n=1 Tax=Candidatus Pantoea edessiphila TaxID=2044610 RepID=A0A2P5T169_9GAMM|nr:thiamine phosphate synthase [Candidatus Pantoea edessiphila]PPI88325.1 thiamine phosphate synthase [Candidatus Pantoea edessiphila]